MKQRERPAPQEIEQAQADYAAAAADATNAEITYKRMEKLVATDTISRQHSTTAATNAMRRPSALSRRASASRCSRPARALKT